MRRLMLTIFLLNILTRSLILADLSQRSFFDDSDTLLVRRERQANNSMNATNPVGQGVGPGGFNNFFPSILNLFLSGFFVTPANFSANTSTTFSLTTEFFQTTFQILQYATFVAFFIGFTGFIFFGVAVLYLLSIIAPANGFGEKNYQNSFTLFRSFEDENMPLFDKITSVGYGLLDRGSELYNLVQTPECRRFAMCHLSSTVGDQEANGFVFKDLLRSISSTLDNRGATEGMTRSVNVGLLTGECDEPIMNCPELAPYFKKVMNTVSNYI